MKEYKSSLTKIAVVVVFFVMLGVGSVFAQIVTSVNNNPVTTSNDNSSKNTNTTNVGNVSSNTSTNNNNSSAVNGSVSDNSKTTNTNTAFGGVSNSDSSVNHSGNSSINNSGNSKSSSTSRSTQKQAQQQQSSQANGQTTTIESPNNSKLYAPNWPSVTPAEGTSSGTASTLFGSLGIADTEKYKKIQVILQTLSAEIQAGLISKDDAAPMIASLNTKLMGTVKTQRTLFGLGPETSGKNFLNGLGLLTSDSFYKDSDAQGGIIATKTQSQVAAEQANEAQAAKDATSTNPIPSGNMGNVGH